MAKKVLVLLGTNKGAFILESDVERETWAMRGPYCDGWVIHHVIHDPETGRLHAGGGNPWTGIGVWQSDDFGESWKQSGDGFAYAGDDPAIKSVWSLAATDGKLYAGVEPAGLFVSEDGGRQLQPCAGLARSPDAAGMASGRRRHDPAFHRAGSRTIPISCGPASRSQVSIRTGNGGKTWEPRNQGHARATTILRASVIPNTASACMPSRELRAYRRAALPAEPLWHVSFRRRRQGVGESIENGLPSSFGFPVVVHPRDPDTVFLIPLNGDSAGRYVPDARAAVWRSRDAGKTWQDLRNGLPQQDAYLCILRQAFAADTLDRAGLYFGSNSGSLFASADEGESWRQIAQHLPIIFSVETAVVES
jgi:hypothetical protein